MRFGVFAMVLFLVAALPRPGQAWHEMRHRPPSPPPLVTGVEPFPNMIFAGPVRPEHGIYRYRRYHSHRGLRPWTRAWYRSCARRFQSFNRRTGYYVTYSGRRRFCR